MELVVLVVLVMHFQSEMGRPQGKWRLIRVWVQ